MTVYNMGPEAFIKEVERIVMQMKKKELIPQNTNVKELANKVAMKLIQDPEVDIRLEDMKKPEMIKSLGLACMAECNLKNKFDIRLLFKDPAKVNKADLALQLKNVFSEMLKLQPQYKNKSQAEKDLIEQRLTELAQHLATKFTSENKPLAKNESVFTLFSALTDILSPSPERQALYGLDPESQQRRALHGTDTHVTGAQAIAVPPDTIGNQIGAMNLSLGEETSYQGDLIKPDPGVPDPLGIRLASIVASIAIDAIEAIESTLQQDGYIPLNQAAGPESSVRSPLSTKPRSPTDL